MQHYYLTRYFDESDGRFEILFTKRSMIVVIAKYFYALIEFLLTVLPNVRKKAANM